MKKIIGYYFDGKNSFVIYQYSNGKIVRKKNG